jgi:hypothetical protein
MKCDLIHSMYTVSNITCDSVLKIWNLMTYVNLFWIDCANVSREEANKNVIIRNITSWSKYIYFLTICKHQNIFVLAFCYLSCTWFIIVDFLHMIFIHVQLTCHAIMLNTSILKFTRHDIHKYIYDMLLV